MGYTTCAISNLQIEEGTDVKVILLTENPYNKEKSHKDAYDIFSWWCPRSVAINAKYDDFGICSEFQNKGIQSLIMEIFQKELIEVGTGDNSYHDVPVSKAMSFSKMMTAIDKGRVYVEKKESNIEFDIPTPDCVPTLQKIQDIVGSIEETNLLVDELDYGIVRVRDKSYGYDFDLNTIIHYFSKFACCVRTGSGSYPHRQELVIFIPPNDENAHLGMKLPKSKSMISYSIVRKDVWNKLLNLIIKNDGYKDYTFDIVLDKVKKEYQFLKSLPVQQSYRMFDDRDFDSGVRLWGGIFPFRSDYTDQFKKLNSITDQNVIDEVINGLAELIFINEVLFYNRKYWMPNSISPTINCYQAKIDFCQSIIDVAKHNGKE